MTIIALEGMQFHGAIGFYTEEHVLGNAFEVDIFIAVNTEKATEEDDLFKTVNYEMVYHICLSELRKPTKLIETVTKRILDRLHKQFEQIDGARVKLKKMNPPLGGEVRCASIEMSSGYFDVPSNKSLKKIKDLKL